jgi:dTDP-glucose 4,6-dehydratase
MKNILVTGGAGFIGSNFLRLVLENRDYSIVNLDLLTYSGNLENLAELEKYDNYKFFRGDIADKDLVIRIIEENEINGIINFAAESHVDRSIIDATPFLHSNIGGALNLLNIAKDHNIEKFLHISTDEVYGSIENGASFTEDSHLFPNSPYAASKASADMFVRAFNKTYNLNTIVTRSTNNFGPFQYPEKLIPLAIMNAVNDKKIPVYGDGQNIRSWIFVEDNCNAILQCFEKGSNGSIYNIATIDEYTNLDIVNSILKILGKSENLIEFVKDRPAHDRRYSISADKIKSEIGWSHKVNFIDGLEKTIEWYLNNQNWLESLLKRTNFDQFYKTQYRVD